MNVPVHERTCAWKYLRSVYEQALYDKFWVFEMFLLSIYKEEDTH